MVYKRVRGWTSGRSLPVKKPGYGHSSDYRMWLYLGAMGISRVLSGELYAQDFKIIYNSNYWLIRKFCNTIIYCLFTCFSVHSHPQWFPPANAYFPQIFVLPLDGNIANSCSITTRMNLTFRHCRLFSGTTQSQYPQIVTDSWSTDGKIYSKQSYSLVGFEVSKKLFSGM